MKVKQSGVKFNLNKKESAALGTVMRVLWCNISTGDLDTMGIEEEVDIITKGLTDCGEDLDKGGENVRYSLTARSSSSKKV